VFTRNDDVRTRICGRHAGEDTCVNDKDVICAVDLGIDVDNGSTSSESRIGSKFGGSHPVVGAAGPDITEGERDLKVVS